MFSIGLGGKKTIYQKTCFPPSTNKKNLRQASTINVQISVFQASQQRVPSNSSLGISTAQTKVRLKLCGAGLEIPLSALVGEQKLAMSEANEKGFLRSKNLRWSGFILIIPVLGIILFRAIINTDQDKTYFESQIMYAFCHRFDVLKWW